MNRAQRRQAEKLARNPAAPRLIEDTAGRTFQALLTHATLNKPRLVPMRIWVEIVAYIFKRATKDNDRGKE